MTHPQIKKAQALLPEELKSFAQVMYGRTPDEDLEMVSPELLADTARRHRDLSRKRKSGEVKIEIYTPPLARNGLQSGTTVINVVMDDMPFIIDSVTAHIVSHYRLIHALIHPILHVKRSAKGAAESFSASSSKDSHPESHMHIELQGTLEPEICAKLKEELASVARDVRFATSDWAAVRAKVLECKLRLAAAKKTGFSLEETADYIDFLDYIYNDNFTLLGYREYKFTREGKTIRGASAKGSGLGLLSDAIKPSYIGEELKEVTLDPEMLRRKMPPLSIFKISRPSTVHRPVPLDAITVRHYDDKGAVTGESLIIGLFTSVTYSRSILDVPLLRRKTETVMRLSGFAPGSYNHKALRHILEKYPRDELFQMDTNEIHATGLSILSLQKRQRIALYMRQDSFGRHISCLVYIPRDRYDTRIRLMFESILQEELRGKCTNFYTTLDDSPLARVMFTVAAGPQTPHRINVSHIEARLQEAGREWSERLAAAFIEERTDEKRVAAFARKYGAAFPASYRERYLPKQATYDVLKIEEALAAKSVAVDVYRDKECGPRELRLKIYNPGKPAVLSDVLPLLENMGLKVLSELPFEVAPAGTENTVWLHDFMMKMDGTGDEIDIAPVKPAFEEVFIRTWHGIAENDGLNALVLSARMTWRDIMVLRAYVRYMRQMRYPFGTRYIEKAVTSHPGIAANLAALFHALHDPALQKGSEKKQIALLAEIENALEKVSVLDEDRIIRTIANLVQETLRTNFFQTDKDGAPKTYIALKFNSSNIAGLPDPRPYREIFVYSRRTEGIHLRGDVIARGGIRWSDRQEDFRTEVLGLMKAQQVKNAIIVPMGAKGGFVVKNPPVAGGRAALQQEGIECYKILVRGLLDITDNRKGGKVIPPKNVVRRDGDDPYLVVAADKGTATFSDIANGLSLEYGFWLGDAFASGGSAGYDHKKMGITARGAWESVKRHFREMNHDTQTQPFDVIGVGDMGGDVFGNGMLLSKHIRLVGAFNHMHIFCDPAPDAAAGFAERKRLFDAVQGWDAYDTKKLSKGGRIYLRSEKSLKLTPEIMARLDIAQAAITPAELIQAMLRARTDLLWFGGIGTYVKASSETHADVGDKTNDSLRIDASEIRAKVLGEGANLAITQRGRIEYALAGGRLNADFIDNSGGVDSSDHEVNIKILLGDVTANPKHEMDNVKRNRLLSSMTEEVANLVLRDNYQQAQGLSLMELQATENLASHAAVMRELERKAGLSRKIEKLPDDETIAQRAAAGKGLTRPELGILQAYAKISFARELLASDLPEEPDLKDYWLVDYFPVPLRKKYRAEILQHRLRREIFATTMSNSMINRMGPSYLKDIGDRTGASSMDITRAYIIARESFGVRALWNRIEALDSKIPAAVQLRAMRDVAKMLERETAWFLTRLGREPHIARDIAAFRPGIEELYSVIDAVIGGKLAQDIGQRIEAHITDGLPQELARQIALVPVIGSGCDIIRISHDCSADIVTAARTYFELGEYFHIDWLRRQARQMQAEGRWNAEARDSLIEHLYTCQAGLTTRILHDMKDYLKKTAKAKSKTPPQVVRLWLETHTQQAGQLEPFFVELSRSAHVDLPMLVIAEQRLRNLYGG